MKFYLQTIDPRPKFCRKSDPDTERTVISTELHKCRIQVFESCEAEHFVEAKAKFGFELTADQQLMLEEKSWRKEAA